MNFYLIYNNHKIIKSRSSLELLKTSKNLVAEFFIQLVQKKNYYFSTVTCETNIPSDPQLEVDGLDSKLPVGW